MSKAEVGNGSHYTGLLWAGFLASMTSMCSAEQLMTDMDSNPSDTIL